MNFKMLNDDVLFLIKNQYDKDTIYDYDSDNEYDNRYKDSSPLFHIKNKIFWEIKDLVQKEIHLLNFLTY